MDNVVYSLYVKLGLDDTELREGLKDGKEKASGFGNMLKTGIGTAGKVAVGAIAAVGTAAVALGNTVVKGASEAAAYGDNIDKMSQKLGISAQAYQEWDAILQHSGSSIDGMQRGMMTLATAAENGSDAFAALGLSLEDVASMSQEELFSAVITGLQGMEEGSERAVLAQKLLGGAAKELGPLLNTSAADTEAMRQRVHELGGVMSDEAVKSAAAFQDSLQDMQTAFQGLSRGLLSEFMPSITTVMDGLTAIFSGDTDGGIELISQGIDSVVTTITEKLPEFLDLGLGIVQSLTTALITNLPMIMESGAAILGQLIAGLLQMLPQLIARIPEIIRAMINGFVAAWPQIKQAGIDLGKQIWEGLKGIVTGAKNWGSDMIGNFIGGIKEKATELWESVKEIAQGIADFLHFSVPEKGPLADLDESPRDMMEMYAAGIRKNEHLVTDALSGSFDFDQQSIMPPSMSGAGGLGGFSPTIIINGAELDFNNIPEAAERLMEEMYHIMNREEAAYV